MWDRSGVMKHPKRARNRLSPPLRRAAFMRARGRVPAHVGERIRGQSAGFVRSHTGEDAYPSPLSLRTEQAYLQWLRRYIAFHGRKHPRELGAPEVEQFLTFLAVRRKVSAATQNQALQALLFLYRHVLEI